MYVKAWLNNQIYTACTITVWSALLCSSACDLKNIEIHYLERTVQGNKWKTTHVTYKLFSRNSIIMLSPIQT